MKSVMCVAAVALTLAGCGDASAPKAQDKYAGLDQQILAWRTDLLKSDPACSASAQACSAFEVGCKGERPISPAETAKGVSAKVVVAMSWTALDPKTHQSTPVAGVKQFEKVGGAWTSRTVGPVNLSTCG